MKKRKGGKKGRRKFTRRNMQMDLFGGEEERDKGLAQVNGHTNPEWSLAYQSFVFRWVDSLKVGVQFKGEDFRIQVILWTDLPNPHHPNVWSAQARSVINALLRNERIRVVTGLSRSIFSQAHARRAVVYEKLR